MEAVTKTLFLTGGRKGQTVVLNGHSFVNGRLELSGDPAAIEKTIRYLNVYYQTEVLDDGERHPETPADGPPVPAVVGDVEPSGAGPAEVPTEDGGGHDTPDAGGPELPAARHGHPGTGIKEALSMLDVLDDSHWTTEGLPRVDVVAELTGQDVTRHIITKVAPHFRREV
jgi:hypothetical protein